MLAGNLLLLVDGYDKGLKIGSKGYPSRSVDTTDTEKVLRGSNEGFTESVKTNTALIRKRIRSTDLKVEELTAGVRSNTRLVLVYMKELVYPEVLEQIRQGIDRFVIDGVLDLSLIHILAVEGYARLDFLMKEDGSMYCLEANTLPGMTPTSLLPQEAAALGIDYAQLCENLIEISMRKYQK